MIPDSYHYFRYDKIKWRVLNVSEDRALLLADQALDDQKYNTVNASVTWVGSTIRSWLNGYDASKNDLGTDFTDRNYIDNAFSSAEKGAIVSTDIDNRTTGSYSNNYGGDNTTDKVFLLSSYDLYSTDTSASYGFYKGDSSKYDEARRCKSSTYAKAMGTYTNTSSSYSGNCRWWLRSPGDHSYNAANVNFHGYVYIRGFNVSHDHNGARPALYLDLSSSKLCSPAGTVCSDGTADEIMDPYTLDQEAAGAVIEMINALNDNSDENAVKKARAAYDKLTQAQKDRIDQTILNKLEEIEALYNTNLANSTVTLSKTSYTYTGKKLTPGVTVKLGGKTLTKGTDYTVAYKNNLNAGTAKVTVTGKGKYTGSATANFTIKPVKLSDTSVIDLYVEDTLYYTGKAQAPYYIVKNDNIWYYLVPGTDFTLSGNKKATSIGTYKLVFTGKGNYTGTVTRKYSIKKKRTSTIYCGKASYSKRLGDAQFDLEAYGYDGWDTYQYYDLTYKSSNTKVATVNTWGIVTLKGIGKATITIKLPGDYEYNGATKKVTITVKKPTVKATSISKLTNVKGKKMTVKWKKRAGITGYQIQYTLNKKFKKGVKKITVKKAKTTKKTIAKLKLKKKYFVRIRTYRTIYGKKYYSKWSGAKAVTVKK